MSNDDKITPNTGFRRISSFSWLLFIATLLSLLAWWRCHESCDPCEPNESNTDPCSEITLERNNAVTGEKELIFGKGIVYMSSNPDVTNANGVRKTNGLINAINNREDVSYFGLIPYKYSSITDENPESIRSGDVVYFNVMAIGGQNFATNVSKTESTSSTQNYAAAISNCQFNLHNRYHHAGSGNHRRGHLVPKGQVISYNDVEYILVDEFEVDGNDEFNIDGEPRDELYFPKNSEDVLTDSDHIFYLNVDEVTLDGGNTILVISEFLTDHPDH